MQWRIMSHGVVPHSAGCLVQLLAKVMQYTCAQQQESAITPSESTGLKTGLNGSGLELNPGMPQVGNFLSIVQPSTGRPSWQCTANGTVGSSCNVLAGFVRPSSSS
jgi:hypothetical protein